MRGARYPLARSTDRRSFDRKAAGNPPSVPDRGTFPDDVPVADALDQERPTADSPPEEDPESGVPLEATASDWQEQRETVLIDPEIEEPEQRE